jgi:galactose mutarotase-like enzyme
MCNHAYWNLSGDFSEGTIVDHKLHLPLSSRLMELDETLMTTGNFPPVSGTPFDFHSGLNRIGDQERLTGAIDAGG